MNHYVKISLLALCGLINISSSMTWQNSTANPEPSKSISSYFSFLKTIPTAQFKRDAGFWSNPTDENSTSFFGKLTEPKSQREDWYAVTPYIAEFWCALSNAGFIYVGIKQNSPELIFAGCASIVSHTIPKQWLLYVDKLGVLLILSKAVREYSALKSNSTLLLPLGALGLINGTDAYLARNNAMTLPHVIWHLSAAGIAYYLLQQIKS